MVRALKSGECVGLLPDQVPPEGQGEWVRFFGKEAYTMTLSVRLAAQTGATVRHPIFAIIKDFEAQAADLREQLALTPKMIARLNVGAENESGGSEIIAALSEITSAVRGS